MNNNNITEAMETLVNALTKKHSHIIHYSNGTSESPQDAISNAMDLYGDIIGSMPGNVYWLDTNCLGVGCNNNVLATYGLKSVHDFKGLSFEDMCAINNDPEKVYQKFKADTEEVIRTKKAKLNIEEPPIHRANGEIIYFLSSRVPLFNKKREVIGVVGISTDITAQKIIEERLAKSQQQAERANQLKSEFIENMQHDIRTPISGIYSLLDATYRSNNMEEFKKYLPHVLNASRELLDIHNAVIDFDDIEYGDKPIYDRKFSLLELLHSTIHLNSAAALAHESTLTLAVDNEVPDVVKGDDYRLKKILINLIGNAIKFTEKGKVTVYVSLVTQQDKLVTIRFSVEDTGIGIPEDKLPTIFEKFTRLNPSNRGKFKGSGLGLHIVKKFVNELNAELDVKSIVNEGTVFTVDIVFTLPLVQQLAGEKAHEELGRSVLIDAEQVDTTQTASEVKLNTEELSAKPDEIQKLTANEIHICLIEDSPIAMIAAENILAKLSKPCNVQKAMNVAEACDLLKNNVFDLVICDLGLPDGTGFDIIGTAKENKGHLNYKTPFVALTAHSDDTRKELAKKSGFLGFYNKPFSVDAAEKILVDHVINEKKEPIIVDLALTAKAFNNNEKTAFDMLNMLVASFAEERILFKDAFAHNDYTRARELLHKFRGGVSYMRIPKVDIAAMILHEEVKTYEREGKPLTALNDKLLTLFKSVDDVQDWLERYHKTKR